MRSKRCDTPVRYDHTLARIEAWLEDVEFHRQQAIAENQIDYDARGISDEDGFQEYKPKSRIKFERHVQKAASSVDCPTLRKLADGSVMVHELTDGERQDLSQGPKVAIFCNGKLERTVPKRLLMAYSPVLNKYFTQNPHIHEIRWAGSADSQAILQIIDQLEKADGQFRMPWAEDFVHGVKLYQAAHLWGFGAYTGNLLKFLRNSVSHRMISYDELDAVVHRVPQSDQLFLHVAHNIEHQRLNKRISDPERFSRYLEKNLKLKETMEAIAEQNKAAEKQRYATCARQRSDTGVRYE
jgi:hypothetical protein